MTAATGSEQAVTENIDVKKTLAGYRARPGEYQILELPQMPHVLIDGPGDPNTSPDDAAALESLYPLAYSPELVIKRELARDYVLPPLKGLWWAEDMTAFTSSRDPSKGQWTLMLPVPEWVTREMFFAAVTAVESKSSPPTPPGRSSGNTRRGPLCADTAPRSLRGGTRVHRTDASHLHPGPRSPTDRQAPRGLPQRSAPDHRREAAHDPPAARDAVSDAVIRSHNWSFLIGWIRPTVETWSCLIGRLNRGGSPS